MPTQLLSIGPPQLMKAGVIYALPGVKVTIAADGAAPAISFANNPTLTPNLTPAFVNGMIGAISFAFARAAADTMVTLKRD